MQCVYECSTSQVLLQLKWRPPLLFILARFPSYAKNSSIDLLALEYLLEWFSYFGNFQVEPLAKNTSEGSIFMKTLLNVLNMENILLLSSSTREDINWWILLSYLWREIREENVFVLESDMKLTSSVTLFIFNSPNTRCKCVYIKSRR